MNWPLFLTLLRLLFSPVFLVLYLYYPYFGIALHELPYLLLGIVGLSELSDLLDGIIARWTNQVTALGKLLDPMADSIFRLSVFFSMTQGPIQLPLLLVLCLFIRDSVISTLRTVCALRGVALAARTSGKIKAIIQGSTAFCVLSLLIPYSLTLISLVTLQQTSFYLVFFAAFYTFLSGAEYIWANRSCIRQALQFS
jgi:CDP-diacylglycerol---glycerol-3-phosphate 3-phosphatidyltransferase